MANEPSKDSIIRNFALTTAALKNRNTVFLLTVVIIAFGLFSYIKLPKELFPEVDIPTVLVQTPYPGNSPLDIENLVTRPLEKEIETINGIKELSSNSIQDASLVIVEFNTNVNIEDALLDVKDAVDQAKSELPNDLLSDPTVMDIDLSEFPIININLSGDFSLEELKGYAEYLEERIEMIDEISKVNIKGINEKEIKINVDVHKLESLDMSFYDIESAISSENITMSGGEIKLGKTRRTIRIAGEFEDVEQIGDVIVKHDNGDIVFLKDVAEVELGYEEPTNFARLDKNPVVSLQIVKKSGENLLAATDKIFEVVNEADSNGNIPAIMKISFTNDQSDMVRMQLKNLENSIIMGVILVVLVLFFFLGTRNAMFVGLAIPMSMFLSFVVLSLTGFRINMIVLFSLILALGMLVDNAIVVVENTHRFVDRGYKPLVAARQAVGEIAVPIIVSTMTTLAAFLPLAFWKGMVGEFMRDLPLTLIIVLSSSLFVALIIIPVFSATFIKGRVKNNRKTRRKRSYRTILILAVIAAIFYIIKLFLIANLLAILILILLFNNLFLDKIQRWFRLIFLVKLENVYLKVLTYALKKRNPVKFFIGTVLLLVFTVILFQVRRPDVNFFPQNDPNYINVVAELPVGTDIMVTDSVMRVIEKDIGEILSDDEKKILESVLTTIGTGSSEGFQTGDEPNKALTTLTFVDYQYRMGINTSEILKKLSGRLIKHYPGVQISLEKDDMGPPTGRAVNIEVTGEKYDQLIHLTDSMQAFIEQSDIEGIEGLKIDLEVNKPQLLIKIDREKARRFGVSTLQIASTIRTALFGKEISDFKIGEDEYPIQLRLQDRYRYSVPALMNQKISFQNSQIPISAVADIQYSSTYGAVNRKDMDRVVTLYSNVIEGYNATKINRQLELLLENFKMPEGYQFKFTGEQKEQMEAMNFLGRALMIAMALILLILVTQFNSLVRPVIIMISVLFSTIGVFGGLSTFKMEFIIAMTGVGIISLAGIVVNNAIVLIDYIGLLKDRKRKELGLEKNAFLPVKEATECVVQGGKTRLRPVLLTAITTILGLLPLATGMNINFNTMLSDFNPQLYFGGDMVKFWGPISWTVIFGLTFATFLTLVIVPVMYRLTILIQKKIMHVVEKR